MHGQKRRLWSCFSSKVPTIPSLDGIVGTFELKLLGFVLQRRLVCNEIESLGRILRIQVRSVNELSESKVLTMG